MVSLIENKVVESCVELKEQLQLLFSDKVVIEIDERTDFLGQVKVELNQEVAIIFLLTSCYPQSPPIVLVKVENETEQIHLHWDESVPVRERLNQVVDLVDLEQVRKVYGTPNGLKLTRDKELAKVAGWQSTFSLGDVEVTKRDIHEGIFSRTLGVLSKDILTKRVLVIGVGSVGSYISDQLIRSGLVKLTVIDHDVVEFSNLSRTVYTLQDVNLSKVEALARHLYNINPAIELDYYEKDITSCESSELIELMNDCDFIVATTDEPEAQRVINRFAYGKNKPAVFIGLYQGADGGEVILSLPEVTPCYQCATSVRHGIERDTGRKVGVQTDYGTGKLEGVVALAADIHHVTSAAVKLILSLLIPEESTVSLNGFARTAVDKEFSYLTLSMKDQYWFYSHIFQKVPGQYAYQSVWLSPTKNEECPICGERDYRSSLLEEPVKAPSIETIRKALQ